jgi:hypothetical protein
VDVHVLDEEGKLGNLEMGEAYLPHDPDVLAKKKCALRSGKMFVKGTVQRKLTWFESDIN